MAKDVFLFSCPCCGKQVELDTRSGKARAVKPGEAKGGQDLDSLWAAQKKESQRLDNVFDSARDDHRKQEERLEDMLRKAKEDAKKSPDEKTRRPFDLD